MSILARTAGCIVSELGQGSAAFFSCGRLAGGGREINPTANRKVGREISCQVRDGVFLFIGGPWVNLTLTLLIVERRPDRSQPEWIPSLFLLFGARALKLIGRGTQRLGNIFVGCEPL